METKVIKPLLRSLFISYALSALFLGALAFALYKLRLGESLVNLLIFAVYFASSLKDGMVVSLLSSAHFCYFYVFTVVVALVISYVTLIAKILPAPLAQILRR